MTDYPPAVRAPFELVRRPVCGWFLAQGIAVLAWWSILWAFPDSRKAFRMGGNDAVLLAFWLPDLLLLAAGSLLAAALGRRGHAGFGAAAVFTCGAVSYATLYCAAFAFAEDAGWLGVTLMLPAMLLSTVGAAAALGDTRRLFRRARPAGAGVNLAKTFIQAAAFWGVLLFLLPALLVELERRAGLRPDGLPDLRWPAAVVFALASALGLRSAAVMARLGSGTPLPLDAPRALVVRGPYARVRNPMAVAGTVQGLAVAVFLGSWVVAVYSLIGSWIWNFLVRPIEEDDLARHFGAPYELYRREVPCWRIRASPYRTSDPAPVEPASIEGAEVGSR